MRRYLIAFGSISILILSFPIPLLFGDALLWEPRNLPIELMLSSFYFALGVVMLGAASRPLKAKVLVDFIILANILHAIIMVVYAENAAHLIIDAGTVGLMGLLPLLFYPWGLRSFLRSQD